MDHEIYILRTKRFDYQTASGELKKKMDTDADRRTDGDCPCLVSTVAPENVCGKNERVKMGD